MNSKYNEELIMNFAKIYSGNSDVDSLAKLMRDFEKLNNGYRLLEENRI